MKSILFGSIGLGIAISVVNAEVAPAGIPVQFQIIEPSLSIKAPCITASDNFDGSSVVIQECVTNPAFRSWIVENGGVEQGTGPTGTIQIFDDKCLDVTDGVDEDGTKLQIWTCAEGNTNQMWNVNSDLTIRWAGKNKCVDLTNGNMTDGNAIQIWDCVDNDANQEWNPEPALAGVLLVHRTANAAIDPQLCLTPSSNSDGGEVQIQPCDITDTNMLWQVPTIGQSGTLNIFNGTKCLDVTNGVDADGTKLQIWSCVEGDTNQAWTMNGNLTIQWENHSRCVDLTNGDLTPDNQVQIWDCIEGNLNQFWVTSTIDPS